MKIKIKSAFPSGGEKHTPVRRRRVVDRWALRWGAAGGVGVETGNSFPRITQPHHSIPSTMNRLIGLPPRHSPPPPTRHRPYPPLSPPPLFASSSLWLQQTSRLQITHDDDDDSLREVVHGGDVRACVVCACARVRTCHWHGIIVVYLPNPPHHRLKLTRCVAVVVIIICYNIWYYIVIINISCSLLRLRRIVVVVWNGVFQLKLKKNKLTYVRK